MNEEDRKNLYKKAWNEWGSTAQLMVFMEECAELIQAISKYERFSKFSAQPSRDLVEEIADVEIMIEQIDFQNNWEDFRSRIEQAKSDKLRRLEETLNEGMEYTELVNVKAMREGKTIAQEHWKKG